MRYVLMSLRNVPDITDFCVLRSNDFVITLGNSTLRLYKTNEKAWYITARGTNRHLLKAGRKKAGRM